MHGSGGRASESERQREGRGGREIPSDTLKSDLQPPVPPTPRGPIQVTMSSLSNLGLTVRSATEYQLLAGRLLELARQGSSHWGRHPDNPPLPG